MSGVAQIWRDAALHLRSRDFYARTILTVIAAALGGLAAQWIGVPIPWLIGPILSTLLVLSVGRPVSTMSGVHAPMIGIIGSMLGASFTLDIFSQIASWWMLFLGLIVASTISSTIAYFILRRFGRLDPPTSFFGSTPGGLIEMSLMSEHFGGDMRSAFLIHTLRVSLVVLILPQLLNLLADAPITNGAQAASSQGMLEWQGAGWLLLCLLLGKPIAGKLRLQAPELLGPLFLSALLHVGGFTDFKLPFFVVASAQAVIGINMGGRFAGVDRNTLLRLGCVTLLLVTVHLGSATAAAVVMARLTGHDMIELVLAYAPGGIAEMSIITLAVGGNIALVAIHHLLRVSLVLFVAPPLYRALFHKNRDPST
ncbi:AbrB family transcriptional regulator [Puniceibacterium sp. IMCC21224]|uniref:AbrB family transcriptional regulator n=1 Tax=Puniceibacterium sp. IMCC21224 TaxID=1618204 RepID=UPI00064D9D10|nr:AbrB family transcriptional regulator [Puniceibacterium sp. IMCC21224]KMK65099.1 membrane protein AbrB duplication [Puniceibacterium sp. IMCC21224]